MSRTLVTIGVLIFSFSLNLLLPKAVQKNQLKLIKEVEFSDESALQALPWSFCIIEDDCYLVPDHREGLVKVFRQKGRTLKLINKFGPKGNSTYKFNKPAYCVYDKVTGKLWIIDTMIKKVFIFKKIEMEFKSAGSMKLDCYDLKPLPNREPLIISGYVTDKKGKPYDLYLLNAKAPGQKQYLLPSPQKYQLSDIEYSIEYKGKRTIPIIGIRGFVDVRGNDAYFIWEGKLKITKIDLDTRKRVVFGQPTEYYVEPNVSADLQSAYLEKNYTKVIKERAKMSLIRNIFAATNSIYVAYEAPREGNLRLQRYTPEGTFSSDIQIPGNRNQLIRIDKYGCYLYSLIEARDNHYKISVYQMVSK